MLSAFVRTLVALQACFPGVSAADSSRWFTGCLQAGSSAPLRLRADAGGVRDLDPAASCSVRCLEEGYQVAALSSDTCYCGNQLNGLVVSECFNTSSKERTKDLKRGSERQSSLDLMTNDCPPCTHCVNNTVCLHVGTVVSKLDAENCESSPNRRVRVCVEENRMLSPQAKINPALQTPASQRPLHNTDRKSVRIHATKRAYPTNAEITFQVVVEELDPEEFVWHFGDSTRAKTNLKTIKKKYSSPGSYNIVVVACGGGGSASSDVFPVVVQRRVKLNRLVHRASVLQSQMVRASCRVNVGTNLTFTWSFGDGTTKLGQSVEEHVYDRLGEFRIEVTASNLVSSASVRSHIFVVDRPCQPPAVKNMGPNKLQVRRYEVVRLGVTYEKELDCDVSAGLNYSWTLVDSAGRVFPLTPSDTHGQSLTLQSHLLQYDTYTAIARVQVVGSLVYSNYSVRVQVMASPPVAFIRGGTNIFISRSDDAVSLDGAASYDPDFPMSPLSYSWSCKPVSSISTSCFDQHVRTSSPLLQFPVSSLKRSFDQFHFTLTVHSEERSAWAETFITISSDLARIVSVHCPQCQGHRVNWDQPFSVAALCEDCNTPENLIQYSWCLYLVNASSKPAVEVPFCYTADLGAPSAVMEGPTTSAEAKTRKKRGNKAGLSPSEPFAAPLDLDNNSNLYLEHFGQSDVISEFPADPESSAEGQFYFPLLESGPENRRVDSDDEVVHFARAVEGDPGTSAGRPSVVDEEGFTAGDDSTFHPSPLEEEGSNLVDLSPPVAIREPTLLDLPRDSVNRRLFESYTRTGISTSVLSFRPFSLRPRSRYMLDVTAKSQNSLLGRTQLFLKTSGGPEAMTCQVQPVQGVELHTHFSIFCTSGREDLLYQYSYSVGGETPRILYQGRDFQYFFSLPSGDPSDSYKVTIYTEVRSSTHGSGTKPCPVSIQVQPSFLRNTSSSSHHDPAEELSESAPRNLTALLQLGNDVETRNYVSLLSVILNRLSVHAEANAHAQRRMRSLLIHTVCALKTIEEASMSDSIRILKDLLMVTNQVTLVSARRVVAHVQQISDQFTESRSHRLNQKTLATLIHLLSFSLQVVTSCTNDSKHPVESHSSTGGNFRDSASTSEWFNGRHIDWEKSVLMKRARWLVAEILQTASALVLKWILLLDWQQLTVSSGLFSFHAALQNQTSTVVRFGSSTFYTPASLIQAAPARRACVLTVLMEVARSPYTWATSPAQLNGPVVELSLYECNTRRKMPIRFLHQPINIILTHPQRNSSMQEFSFLRNQVNYHSFNITQEHLQQAIQLTLIFTPPSNNKAFPIMLLFSMFEKPTPSMHHLYKIHRWRSNIARVTLLPSYLSAAGVGYLALLDADFEKTGRTKHRSEEIRYRLSVVSSGCLSWRDQQRHWTHQGCRTQQRDSSPAVNCSCHLLRPFTVAQQQIQSSHDTADLEPFLSDLTVLSVLLLGVFLCVPALAACKRADAASEENRGVHFLSDNSPSDPHLYAVTVHTGICSAARMSAKVYIVLHGEHRVSQTKELQVPGCTLFRRNSQNTFILSAADSLGDVRGVHIWHDSSGPSPDWYLKHVEVSEISRGNELVCAWLFVGQCWLAVNNADGRVEKMLQVYTGGLSFSKMLCYKLSDYFADFHIWASVYSCSSPNSFTHTQRLSVCMLLFLGYACINGAIISQLPDQLEFEPNVISVSPVSVVTGLLSILVVLPVAVGTSFLFRRCCTKPTGVQRACLAWTFCLLSSFCCLVLSTLQGMRFNSGDVLLWFHSLGVSLVSCIFLIQPAVIFTVAVTVSCWYRREPGLHGFFSRSHFHSEALKTWSHDGAHQEREQLTPSDFSLESNSFLEKRVEARQRARFLRHVHPPGPTELRKTRLKRRRDQLILKTLRELFICTSMLFLMVCITHGCSYREHCLLNRAVAKQFIRNHHDAFRSVQQREQWWTWTQTSLLHLLYENPSTQTETHILIGEPILQKTETSDIVQRLVSTETRPRTCTHLGRSSVTVGLGRTKYDAAAKLKFLYSAGWVDGPTVALKVQFTLYSPAPNLFTSVTLLAEQSPSGALLPSVTIQSVRVHHTPAVWDHVAMACQALFFLLSLLQLCHQVSNVWHQGLMGYWRTPSNWVEVSLLTVTLLCYVFYIHHSALIMEVVELLQSPSYKGPVDVSQLAACEQFIRTLRGILLFLLTVKCVTVLSVNATFTTSTALCAHSLSSLLWPVISGLIFLLATSCLGNLLYGQNSQAFNSIPRSFKTVLGPHWGPGTTRDLLQSGSDSLYCGVLCLSSTLVWAAMVVAVMSLSVRRAKQSLIKRRDAFTFSELVVYVKERIYGLTKQHEQASTDHLEMRKSSYLEEFESLVDELLFKLNSLSDGGESPAISSIDTQETLLRRHWTEDAPEKQGDQLVGTRTSCWLNETRTLQTEVVVEVLVHDEPEQWKDLSTGSLHLS